MIPMSQPSIYSVLQLGAPLSVLNLPLTKFDDPQFLYKHVPRHEACGFMDCTITPSASLLLERRVPVSQLCPI